MCPTLRGNGISRSEKLNEERDTIPKPVGLGMRLQYHNTNSHRTNSNAVRICSISVQVVSEKIKLRSLNAFERPVPGALKMLLVPSALVYLNGETRPSLAKSKLLLTIRTTDDFIIASCLLLWHIFMVTDGTGWNPTPSGG